MKSWFRGLLLGLMPSLCSAYIYEIKVARLKEAAGDHYVLGMSDFHDKTSAANQEQLASLDTFFKSCDRSKTDVVVEDLSSPGSGGRQACGRFQVNSRGGVLGGQATKCSELGFDVKNVEYRICRVAALGPVLNNLNSSPHEFPSVSALTVADLVQEIENILKDLKTYDDGEHLNTQYKQGIQTVEPQLAQWKDKDCCQLSVAHYLEKYSTPADRLELLKHLLTFDSELVDLEMAHHIISKKQKLSTGKPHLTVVIGGGAHNTRMVEMLIPNGYDLVHETDVQYYKEYDLKKCLGSTIVDGSYCIRPEPISLEGISKFL